MDKIRIHFLFKNSLSSHLSFPSGIWATKLLFKGLKNGLFAFKGAGMRAYKTCIEEE